MEKPANTYGKPLASGETFWAWQPNSKDRKRGCPLGYTALGTDTLEAFRKAKDLNQRLKDWRAGIRQEDSSVGTLDWLLTQFLASENLVDKSKSLIDGYKTRAKQVRELRSNKTGRLVKDARLSDLTGMHALNIYKALKKKYSLDMANRIMKMLALAWDDQHVFHEKIIPQSNPFRKVRKTHHEASETQEATYAELQSTISALIAEGEIGLAIGARLCWDFHIRPTQVFSTCMDDHYRPRHREHLFWIAADKTSHRKSLNRKVSAWFALDDKNEAGQWECMFPELDALMRMRPYEGGLLCQRQNVNKKGKPYGEFGQIKQADKKLKRIREKYELPEHITFEAFRHGGLTEVGEVVPDTLFLSRSLHQKRETANRYIHRNMDQSTQAQKLRLASRKDV